MDIQTITKEVVDKYLTDKDGITMTSANHLCNLANELSGKILDKYKSLGFVNVTASIPNNSNEIIISKGMTDDQLSSIISDLEEVSRYHSLIAWFKEAIKIKSEYLSLLRKDKSLADNEKIQSKYLSDEDLSIKVDRPSAPQEIDEDSPTYKSKVLSIKELNEYYSSNSRSSVIGKYIHQSSPFQKFRDELRSSLISPSELKQVGDSLVSINKSPSLDESIVESLFYELQSIHRSNEARLNSLRQKVRTACQEENDRLRSEYLDKLSKYNESQSILSIRTKDAIEKEYRKVSSLKIIIPNDLREVYDKLNNL